MADLVARIAMVDWRCDKCRARCGCRVDLMEASVSGRCHRCGHRTDLTEDIETIRKALWSGDGPDATCHEVKR